MHNPGLNRTRRHLPHWELDGSTYFLTFRLKQGELSPAERQIVYDHILSGDAKFYQLLALMIMPDHVHLIARPNPGVTLSRMMQGIKGVSARRINQHRDTIGPLWQDESYDRIMRDADEAIEKANYMHENPCRAGLAETPDDYCFWYRGDFS